MVINLPPPPPSHTHTHRHACNPRAHSYTPASEERLLRRKAVRLRRQSVKGRHVRAIKAFVSGLEMREHLVNRRCALLCRYDVAEHNKAVPKSVLNKLSKLNRLQAHILLHGARASEWVEHKVDVEL
jgi:hypothetical protein